MKGPHGSVIRYLLTYVAWQLERRQSKASRGRTMLDTRVNLNERLLVMVAERNWREVLRRQENVCSWLMQGAITEDVADVVAEYEARGRTAQELKDAVAAVSGAHAALLKRFQRLPSTLQQKARAFCLLALVRCRPSCLSTLGRVEPESRCLAGVANGAPHAVFGRLPRHERVGEHPPHCPDRTVSVVHQRAGGPLRSAGTAKLQRRRSGGRDRRGGARHAAA